MKKNIFILSALLTLVVSGICLQSCSSEYDEYTTEEYGYYTEEEIDAIEALAEKYGLTININEDFYGKKKNLIELDRDFQMMASVLGTHDMTIVNNDGSSVAITSSKIEGERITHTATRYVEGSGEWSDERTKDEVRVKVEIKWDGGNRPLTATISSKVTVDIPNSARDTSLDKSSGSVSCSFVGESGINFSGGAKYSMYEYDERTNDYILFVEFTFNITNGEVSTKAPVSGSFELT